MPWHGIHSAHWILHTHTYIYIMALVLVLQMCGLKYVHAKYEICLACQRPLWNRCTLAHAIPFSSQTCTKELVVIINRVSKVSLSLKVKILVRVRNHRSTDHGHRTSFPSLASLWLQPSLRWPASRFWSVLLDIYSCRSVAFTRAPCLLHTGNRQIDDGSTNWIIEVSPFQGIQIYFDCLQTNNENVNITYFFVTKTLGCFDRRNKMSFRPSDIWKVWF